MRLDGFEVLEDGKSLQRTTMGGIHNLRKCLKYWGRWGRGFISSIRRGAGGGEGRGRGIGGVGGIGHGERCAIFLICAAGTSQILRGKGYSKGGLKWGMQNFLLPGMQKFLARKVGGNAFAYPI